VFELPSGSPGIFSYVFGALAFLAFAAHIGAGWRGGSRATVLLATVAFSAVWAGLSLGFALTLRPAFWISQTVVDALRIDGWLLFMVMLLGGPRLAMKAAPALLLFPVAAWVVVPAAPFGELRPAFAPSQLAYSLLLGISVTGLVLTEQVFRRAHHQSRWSIKPLCLGLGSGFVFDLYMYADALMFGRLDANIWAARGFAQALVIPFIALATVRNKDWTIDLAISRGVVFHSTAVLASGIYLLAIATAGYFVRYFGGSWGKTFQIGFIFAALLLLGWLCSSGMLRAKLKVFINKNFFSYRYDYRQEWLGFANMLSGRVPDISAPQRCIQALANLVESPAGALWLRNENGTFTEAAGWNMPRCEEQLDAEQPLPKFLHATGWVVNIEEYRNHPANYPQLVLPQWLDHHLSAWLLVPILAQGELIGFMVLTRPRAAIEVNWEVLDLLKTAARQVGSFLSQIQASEALLEAKKFDAFNKMTAFVVHDLKNLVAQLSLLLKNAERHRENPRFQKDMLSTVEHVTDRMTKLLLQLSIGGQGRESLRPVNLGRLAKRIVAAKAHERADIAVEASAEVMALGHELRFERVIGHLVQNAIEASDGGGNVAVRVYAEAGCALVDVRDTGCGMNEEFLRDKLFRAFQTTKASGMGIGAYETAQYVREVGGRIEATSRPGSGTRIKIILPLYGEPVPRDHQDREVA
jgi:putative PEP-CTERM system histidine kinase